MSLDTSRITPSPPKADLVTQVFSNPYLRSRIFHDIHQKLLAPILRVSKLFLEGGVETLYRNFDYQNYHKLIKRCEDKERLNLYLGSVRTVDLSRLTRTIQIAKWASLLSSFPNASLIKRYNDTLTRHYPSDNANSEPQYTYFYPYAEQLTKTPHDIPENRPGIPKSWKQVKRVSLNAYSKDFEGDEETRAAEWKRVFLARMKELDSPLEGISIDFPVPNRVILEALREVEERGLGTPKMILLKSSDQDLFEMLDLVSPTLTNLNIWINITYDNSGISLQDFLTKIPWNKLRCLSIIKLSVRRFPTAAEGNHESRTEEDPSLSFHPKEFGTPFGTDEIHLFSEFNLQIVYPPYLTEDPFEHQIQLDLAHLPSLAESMVPLLGMFASPSLTIRYGSKEQSDVIKSNMYSRKMNDGLWKEMSVIRKAFWEKKKEMS
ncbi:hypothetical protein I302_101382 [Kwoniella bestiolae CBS 10118]|uniref:Uncharacterized protein n=1 Tax=Kwoniella bestiolae CBS 10118 TaxID=1296100 RepID=A0A1B9GC23_9TREE|nr:hypothetical protein I302_00065 [Kwoniella bestiolae CBS 10118]OCF28577.1 hypothetical protein I302_00065 [Kwoniella bestiolae CBS 10118]